MLLLALACPTYSAITPPKILKIWRSRFIKTLAILGLSAFLGTNIQRPAASEERAIFGESSATIEEYFGQYWTRLTIMNSAGDRVVTYTYSPGEMRNFFDNAECLRLSVEFINDRATEVSVHCNGAGFDIPSDQNEFSDNSIKIFDDVFEYIFGERPPTDSPIYHRNLGPEELLVGTLHTVTHCMSEEIAISYEWISTPDFIWFIDFFQESICI